MNALVFAAALCCLTLSVQAQTNNVSPTLPQNCGFVNQNGNFNTNNTGGVQVGIGVVLTMARTGRVSLRYFGNMTQSTVGDGGTIAFTYGIGAVAPASGVLQPAGSTQTTYHITFQTAPASGSDYPISSGYFLTGLTVGQSYWFDVFANAETGGFMNLYDSSFEVCEK